MGKKVAEAYGVCSRFPFARCKGVFFSLFFPLSVEESDRIMLRRRLQMASLPETFSLSSSEDQSYLWSAEGLAAVKYSFPEWRGVSTRQILPGTPEAWAGEHTGNTPESQPVDYRLYNL